MCKFLSTGPPNEVLDQLTVAPGPNFAGTVQLSCAMTGPSPLPTCDAGGSGAIGNGGTWTPTLTVQDPAPTKSSQGRHDILQANPQLARFVDVAWLPLILGITLLQRSQKRRAWQAAGFLPLLLLGLCSCGGSSQTQTQTPPVYTVIVTGTSTAKQHIRRIPAHDPGGGDVSITVRSADPAMHYCGSPIRRVRSL